MANTVVNQTNINLLTLEQYESLTPNDNELYAVRVGAIVIETYSDGTNWYRLYSDGWCEQGGTILDSAVSVINLLKAYKTNTYNLTGCSNGPQNRILNLIEKTNSSFKATSYGYNEANQFSWVAKGYVI